MAAVMAHGRFVHGPEVAEFEGAFARYCGTSHCIGTSNGTSAIGLVLRAAGIGPGDDVITTTMTFIATVEPIVLVGARPVLVDVDPDTGLIDGGVRRSRDIRANGRWCPCTCTASLWTSTPSARSQIVTSSC